MVCRRQEAEVGGQGISKSLRDVYVGEALKEAISKSVVAEIDEEDEGGDEEEDGCMQEYVASGD